MFFGDFGCFPTGPNVVPKIRKLVPDWIPTGSRLAKSGAQKCKNWCPIGSRLGPDWVPTGSRPGFFKKTPISLNLSTYFWNFSTLPCTTPPLRFPLRTPPPPVLSQTRAWQGRMPLLLSRIFMKTRSYIWLLGQPWMGSLILYLFANLHEYLHVPAKHF